MPLKPNSAAMTLLLGLTVGLAPLTTDLYLPALPAMAAYFNTPPAAAQATLSSFLLGFALGQILFGPISDRLGRRPVLLWGLALFILLTIVCAVAPTIEILIVARFFQALTACAPVVIARAVVRDMHEGVEAARQLALMSVITGVVPAVAPAFGGVLAVMFDWRSHFIVMALAGIANFAVIYWHLPETLRQRTAAPLSFAGIAQSFGIVWASPAFRAYAALICLSFSGLFAIISGSPFVLQEIYGMSEIGFGVAFGGGAVCYVISSLTGFRLTRAIGIDTVLAIGVSALALAGLIMVGAVLFGADYRGFVLAMMIYGFGMGMTFPQAMAGALVPFPERAGAASSLAGFLQMSVAALIGVAVGLLVGDSPWPLAGPVCFFGLLAIIVYFATVRIRRTALLISIPAKG